MTVVRIQLGPAALEAIQRPVRGQGGFQSLLREIQRQLGEGSDLQLVPSTVGKIARYVQKYGEGGFQGRLKHILNERRSLAKALRPLAD